MQHMSSYQQYHEQDIELHCFSNSPPFTSHPPPPSTPDLLNMFHSPSCSALQPPPPAGNFRNSSSLDILYDSPPPPLHLNLPPHQTPIFKELFHYSLFGDGGVSGSGGMDHETRDQLLAATSGCGVYQDGDHNGGRQYDNSTLDFSRDMNCAILGMRGGRGGTTTRHHFATERQRREQFNSKYNALRALLPNSTKSDRASIVLDATEYIKELMRTVEELKILVDKKRDTFKKLKREDDDTGATVAGGDMEPLFEQEQCRTSNEKRTTWVQRKSKETHVDVRIIHDEVTVKLVQRNKTMNCLLYVSRILDELQLDILHVSGGNIGESYCYLFNAKIYEGSSVYAYAIANKLTEALDKKYAAFQPGSI